MKWFDQINKRLIFVSGKGGVGKTTVSLLLASEAVKQKKRTLLLEINSLGQIRPLFDINSNDHEDIPIAPYLSHINLRPSDCFEEYVIKQIRFKTLYKTFFDNKFVTHFTEAVPGLAPILMLGKIHYLMKQTESALKSTPLYDTIIVDCPATGHGLSLFEVPQVLEKAVKIGPLHSHASEIIKMLGSKETLLCPVTLAEEMPVSETIEFVSHIQARTNLNLGPILVNQVWPEISDLKITKKFPEEFSFLSDYYSLAQTRNALNKQYVKTLKASVDLKKYFAIPFFKQGISSFENIKTLANEVRSL